MTGPRTALDPRRWWATLRGYGWRLLAVVVVAAVVRTGWVLAIHAKPISDYLFYFRSATALVHGHGFAIFGHPTAFFPIGYPAFLAPFLALGGGSITVARGSGILLGIVSAGLAFLLGDRMGGRNAGLIAGFAFALAPDFIVYSGLLASENLMIPLLLGVCLLLASVAPAGLTRRRAVWAGVIIGAATLVRPAGAVVLPVFLVYLWARGGRRGLVNGLVIVAAAIVIVTPWVIRNAVVVGEPTVSTNGGYTLQMGLDARATGGPLMKGGNPPWPIGSAAQEVASDRQGRDAALDYVTGHPWQAIALIPEKAYYLFRWTDALVRSNMRGAQTPLGPEKPRTLSHIETGVLGRMLRNEWMLASFHYAWLVLGAAGLVLGVARRRPAADWLALVFVAWVVVHITLFHGQSRFLVSVSPLLAPAIGYLLVTLAGLVRRRRPATAPADATPA